MPDFLRPDAGVGRLGDHPHGLAKRDLLQILDLMTAKIARDAAAQLAPGLLEPLHIHRAVHVPELVELVVLGRAELLSCVEQLGTLQGDSFVMGGRPGGKDRIW